MGTRTRGALLALAFATCLLAPTSAYAASVQLGQIQASNPSSTLCAGPATFIQSTTTPGIPSYSAPFAGVVTRWRTRAADQVGPLKLKIARRTSTANRLFIVGQDEFRTLTAHNLHAFSVRIPVIEGDLIGLGLSNSGSNCGALVSGTAILSNASDPASGTEADFTPGGSLLLNIEATLETDVDRDGLGDDTQDTDDDGDGVPDGSDNCSLIANPAQVNTDGAADGGDECDGDDDNDGVADEGDNCRTAANAEQRDLDGNGAGDACDPDSDGDGLTDAAERALGTNPQSADSDGDGVADRSDRCPLSPGAGGCRDASPPTLVVSGVRSRMSRASFLKGFRAAAEPGEEAALEFVLEASPRGARLARWELVLTRRSLAAAAGRRQVQLKPNRRLVGRSRRFKTRLTVIATDGGGNRTVRRRTITIR